jgi:hypothetical protein
MTQKADPPKFETTCEYRLTLNLAVDRFGFPAQRRVAKPFPTFAAARTWADRKLATDRRYDAYEIEELTSQVFFGPPAHGATLVTHRWSGNRASADQR